MAKSYCININEKVFLSYIKLYSPFEFHINFGDNARGMV